jgi:hypothetical protein
MSQLVIGVILIAIAAIVGFYGTQLAREGWTKRFSQTPAPLESAAPTPMKKDDKPSQNINTTGQSGGQNIIAGGNVTIGATPAEQDLPTFSEKVDKYVFFFGGGGMIASATAQDLEKGPQTPFTFGNFHPIKVYMEHGKFFVDVTWRVGTQRADVRLQKDKASGRMELSGRPEGWEMNSNDRVLEILDETGSPVFQFIKKDASHIVINGVFSDPLGGVFIATDDGFVQNAPPNHPLRSSIKRIFKYPAWKHPGEYDQ